MAARPNLQPVEQLGMDEQTISDSALEDALEELYTAKEQRSEANKAVKSAKADVDKGIEKLELPDGHAVRVGRFRITRRYVEARDVEFSTDARSQVSIAVVGGR